MPGLPLLDPTASKFVFTLIPPLPAWAAIPSIGTPGGTFENHHALDPIRGQADRFHDLEADAREVTANAAAGRGTEFLAQSARVEFGDRGQAAGLQDRARLFRSAVRASS
jgi:hypothetical protein